MTANEYGQLALTKQADQEQIRIRVYTLGALATQLDNASRGISEEAGECQAVVKRWLEYGKPLDRARGLDEAGDVLWRVNQYLNALGFTLEDAMAANLRKLDVRRDGGFDAFRAADENRDRAAEAAAVASKLVTLPGNGGERFLSVGSAEVTADEQQLIHDTLEYERARLTAATADERSSLGARREAARVAVQQGRRILQEQARATNVGPRCTRAPADWECQRTEGHPGPCAANPTVPGGPRPEDPDLTPG